MSQTVRYVLDIEAAAAEASVRKAADAIDDAAKAADKATTSTARFEAATESLAAEAGKMSAKVAGSGTVLRTHAADLDGAAVGASNMKRGLSSVAMQMPDVIAQISAGTPPLRALTQQGLQVVQSMDMMTLASKAFSPAGAAVAAVALSLGAAWAYLSYELTQAEEKMARQATMAGKLGDAHGKFDALVSQAASELALATGQTDRATEAAKAREAAIRSAADAERAALDGIVSTAKQELAAAEGTEARVAALDRITRAEEQRAAAMAGVAADEKKAIKDTQQLAEYQRELAESNEELARRDRAAAEAAKGRAAAEREKAEALRQAAAAAAVAGFGATQEASAFGFAGNLARVQSQTTARDFGFAGPEVDDMFKRSLRSALASASTEDALSKTWVNAIEAAARSGRMTDVLAQAGGALGAVVNPLSALSATGPQGAAAGAILQALEQIGSEGTDAIVLRLESQADAIVQGFASLPELMDRLIEELPYSIGQSIAEALSGILKPERGYFNPERILNRMSFGLYGLGKGLVGAPEVGEGFAVGDQRYVSRTGMALVHEGERVVRSNGGGSSVTRAAASQGGYAGPPIIIQAAAVAPDVLSGLSDVVGAAYNPDGWGRGTRAVFGGG